VGPSRDIGTVEFRQPTFRVTARPLEWNASSVAKYLWKAPKARISDGTVNNVKLASAYLETCDYQIEGVEADGNCFFSAFLESYNTLARKITLLDTENNKISYLRSVVASYYKDKPGRRE
jgi:hypothetical protein